MRLYAEEIGQRRLQELRLRVGHCCAVSFNAKELGEYSIRKQPVLVVLVGTTNQQQWVLMPCTKENIRQHRGHCYLVKGKRIEHIVYRGYGHDLYEAMNNYECADTSRPVVLATHGEMFAAGQGTRTRKKAHMSNRETAQGKVGSLGSVICTKTFPNSRLTCVYKRRVF